MVAKARELELTGPDGFLKLFTKCVLETALNEEIAEHCDPQPGPHRSRPRPIDDALEPMINAFAITFSDRWPDVEAYY
jgi:hypothetical protein